MSLASIGSSGSAPQARQLLGARSAATPFTSLFHQATAIPTPPASGEQIDDLKQRASGGLASFRRNLTQALEAAGVDVSREFRLEGDVRGEVNVVGDHPDKALIEKVFENNPDLASQFRSLAQLYGQLSAAQKGAEPDPLAIAKFSITFDNGEARATMN